MNWQEMIENLIDKVEDTMDHIVAGIAGGLTVEVFQKPDTVFSVKFIILFVVVFLIVLGYSLLPKAANLSE
jgi:phage shock protein PspC (stress-responsive transcriptional regulator)